MDEFILFYLYVSGVVFLASMVPYTITGWGSGRHALSSDELRILKWSARSAILSPLWILLLLIGAIKLVPILKTIIWDADLKGLRRDVCIRN